MRLVAGTCSAGNQEFVRGLGAHVAVDYASEKVEGMFDVVLDCVGGTAREEACGRNVKSGGTVVSVAGPFSSAEEDSLDSLGVKCIFFIVKPSGADLAQAGELIEKGALRPVVDRVFDLNDGADAFDLLGKRHSRGKIVLTV